MKTPHKSFLAPRVVLVVPDDAASATAEAFRLLGLESYRAESPASARKMALREDTLLLFLASDDTQELLATARAARSAATLLVALAPPEDHAALREAGAAAVGCGPPGLATTLKALNRLLRGLGPAREGASPLTDPCEALRRAAKKSRARLKLYLGAAPGVGKTFAMLREAHDLQARHVQVAVGLVETHQRAETAAQLEGLTLVPRREVGYKGTTQTELDLDAILALRPPVVLVDELAHTNAPGSLHAKRYEDVQLLLLAGIPVISTMNIQHLESLNSLVERLTGVKVRETVPDTVLEEADEVVLVDLSPEALQARLAAGKIYARGNVEQSLANFFTTHNLQALRELVLRELADKVDLALEDVRGPEQPTGIPEVVLVCVTASPTAPHVIRRAARLATRLNAELHATAVCSSQPGPELQKHLALAASLEAVITQRQDPDPARAIAAHARTIGATVVVIGEGHEAPWRRLFGLAFGQRLLSRMRNVDLVTVASPT